MRSKMQRTGFPQFTIVVGVLLLHSTLGLGEECWHPQDNSLVKPRQRSCAAQLHEHIYVVGGLDNEHNPTKSWSSIDLEAHSEWLHFTYLPFLVDGQGSCSTVGKNTLYMSQMASEKECGSNLFKWTSTTGEWLELAALGHSYCRAGFLAGETLSYLVGGKVRESWVEHLRVYNASANSWEQGASLAPINRDVRVNGMGLCDCKPIRRAERVFFICQPCWGNSPKFNISIIEFQPRTNQITLLDQVSFAATDNVLSFEAVAMAQYIVISVAVGNVAPRQGPKIYHYDVVMRKLHFMNSNFITHNRYGAATFVSTCYLYYVAGRRFSNSGTGGALVKGNITKDVDELRIYRHFTASINHHNHSYVILEHLVVQPNDVLSCGHGLQFRLATDVGCQTRVNVADSPCGMNDGNPQGIFILAHVVSEAYLCASLGTCNVKQNKRTLCKDASTGKGWSDFGSCNLAGCCWDSEASDPSLRCYNYGEGTSDVDSFFFNVDLQPISVTATPPVATPSVSFFRTKGGVITICVCAAIIVVLAVATIAFFQKRAPELEHPLENNSKYRLVSKLGQGGFGTVFLVQKKGASTTEQYAMKYIACQSEEDRHYAMKEFELIRSAQGHPNMVRLIDMFMSWSNEAESINEGQSPKESRTSGERQALLSLAPRYVCIVMDYFAEGDLSNYILDNFRNGMPEQFVLHVLCKQVATLLKHLHALSPPIVHRDLKPENILLAENGQKVVVTDFGLAQQAEKSYMTTRAGSLHYVAPECWKRHYTSAVDMWGLGCIMYAACTGKVTADTARVMFSDARDRGFERDIRYDLRKFTPLLQDVIIGLLQTDVSKRLTSTQVLAMLETS